MPTIVPTPVTPPEEVEIPPLPISGYTVQAQRTSWEVEPGYLPGACGFDGSAGQDFGDEAEELHNITDIVFVGLFRGGSVGHIVGTPVALPVEEISETDASAVTTTYATPRPAGAFVPRGTTFANTDYPIQGPSSNIGDGENYGLVRSINSQITNDGGTPATADVVPRIRELLYWRLWTDAAQANYVAMEADPARGWLHISAEQKIKTYFAQSSGDGGLLSLAFSSPDHDVLAWRKLVALAHHGGRLACLAETDTEEFTLYLSANAGLTIEESLVMPDALSALVFYVAARDWLVVLWEDSTTNQVKRKISLDGGATWSSATDCQYIPLAGGSLVDLEGALQDKSGMPHAGGSVALVVTPPGSDTAMVLISQDGGAQWRQVL